MPEERDELVPFEDILQPDVRWSFLVSINLRTDEEGPITHRDLYERVRGMQLVPEVPTPVANHFLTALHLLLYSWYNQRFIPVAWSHAFASLEFALKKRFEAEGLNPPNGLFKLINGAVSRGWFRAKDWPGYDGAVAEDVFLKNKLDALRSLRNSLAHGTSLRWEQWFPVDCCAILINQLFARKN